MRNSCSSYQNYSLLLTCYELLLQLLPLPLLLHGDRAGAVRHLGLLRHGSAFLKSEEILLVFFVEDL